MNKNPGQRLINRYFNSSQIEQLKGWPIVAILLVFQWVLAFSSILNKSNTFDEIVHLTSGYIIWQENDYRLVPENGNLAQRWVALPLLLGQYKYPDLNEPIWLHRDSWIIGNDFFFERGNNLKLMLMLGRFMVIFLGLALSLVVWSWSKSLFGSGGGLISLLFCVFSPTILSHCRLMTSDMIACFFIIVVLRIFWKLIHHFSIRLLILSSLSTALLFVSKMSAIIIIPMIFIILTIRLINSQPLHLSLMKRQKQIQTMRGKITVFISIILFHILIIWIVIWAFFGFRYRALNLEKSRFGGFQFSWSEILKDTGSYKPLIKFVKQNHLLPEAYIYGFAYVFKYSQERRNFINGKFSWKGHWYFFPYCFFVKTPLPLLLLLVVLLFLMIQKRYFKKNRITMNSGSYNLKSHMIYKTAPLWISFIVYWAFSLFSHLNIGHRHILPIYPVLFILAGSTTKWIKVASIQLKIIFYGLFITFILASIGTWPHYLAYFNIFAGGSKNAYHHLVDSSLDWGQDVIGLKTWLDNQNLSNQSTISVYVSHFGTSRPDYYGIQARFLPCFPDFWRKKEFYSLKGGVYCISATMLQGIYLMTPGTWNVANEKMYRFLLERFSKIENPRGSEYRKDKHLAENEIKFLKQNILKYEQLRTAKLFSYLRDRHYDDQIGYSILIFRLSDQEIDQALNMK